MNTLPSKEELESYCNDPNLTETMARSEIGGLIMEEVDFTYAKHIVAEVKTQIEVNYLNIIQVGSSAASKRIKTSSSRV